jgi:hypothetical protein
MFFFVKTCTELPKDQSKLDIKEFSKRNIFLQVWLHSTSKERLLLHFLFPGYIDGLIQGLILENNHQQLRASFKGFLNWPLLYWS